MENNISPSRRVKQLDAQINRILRTFNLRILGSKERKIITDLQQNLNDARIYVNAYELSEMREEQLENAKVSKKWLEQARKNILSASEYDIFGAIDVADLTAQIDQIISELK